MKLYEKNIMKSIKNAERSRFFKRLTQIYNSIPNGICKGCTKCCMESVNTFYIEFLNIYKGLKNNEELFKELIPKIMEYYFLGLVKKMPCPFLNKSGKCSIYEFRPLSCRLFGYWDEGEYEENYKRVLRENRRNYKYFKNAYNIEIPHEVVNNKIKYCEDFQADRIVYRNERQSMIDNIFTMESDFFMKGLIGEDFLGTDLVSWFIYMYFNKEEAGELRIKVMREYLEKGESDTYLAISTIL